MKEWLFTMARQGSSILTVNDRLARHLSAQYDRAQQSAGLLSWQRPEILSLNAWLERQLSQLPEGVGQLNPAQCHRVWETIIDDDLAGGEVSLLQLPQTAIAARQAHQLLIQYDADVQISEAAEDHRAFLRWRRQWLTLAERNRWHDPAEAPRLFAETVADRHLPVPSSLVMAGFDEMTPDLKSLCAILEQRGCTVEQWMPAPVVAVRRQRVAARDPADEVRQSARWARQILVHNPAASIGIVAPQVSAYQPLFESILRAELDPSGALGGVELHGAFNLSLGQRLDREGPIQAALRLLRVGPSLSLDEIGWLLRSPYLGGAACESAPRAQFDRELRRQGLLDWSLSQLLRACRDFSRQQRADLTRFSRAVEVLRDDSRRTGRQLPGAWSEQFVRLLHRLGWPGDRGLSSREYQVVERFNRVLGDLASLDRVAAPMLRSEALKTLSHLTGAADFQPQAADGPIQVLGVLEASGLTFDHLWVLGLHDAALPQPPNPNPFIPLPVQRRHRMQRADAERERSFADTVVRRLFSSAAEVVLSWPGQRDGSAQRPSSYLQGIAEGRPLLADSAAPEAVIWGCRPVLETLDDVQARPLTAKGRFSGGTGIIKDQALCPFRAFAHHRLRAERLETPDVGFDSLARGTLAHTVLELFWRQTGDQAGLLALDDADLQDRLQAAATQALDRLEKARRRDLPLRLRQIEQQRLVALARQWLELEKGRRPFRVRALESSHRVPIGSLTIRTRIDRIDELEGGQYAIIDYKTGRPDPAQWVDDRLSEPQMPIYCLGLPRDRIAAVLFALVRGRRRESGFRGLARDPEGWPGLREQALEALLESRGWETFDAVLEHWIQALRGLGDAFAGGVASVDPVDPELACSFCDLTSLCRIHELRSGWTAEDRDA